MHGIPCYLFTIQNVFIQNHNISLIIFFQELVKTLVLVNNMVDYQRVKASSALHAKKKCKW